jgi:hypothetical protein
MPTWSKLQFKDSPLSIAQGEVTGHSYVHKFGAVPQMSNNTTGTVWDVSDTVYPWASWATAGTVSIPAVNASDNGKTVAIVGLDASYNPQTENVVVSSTATVTSTKSFIRIYRAYLVNGSTNNVGNINIQKGGVTVARITAGKSQTLMAIYTVPAGYTAYLTQGTCTCQAGADATGNMYVRYGGDSSFRVGHSFEVSGNGGQYFYPFNIPIAIPEKSDIDVEVSVRTNNARVTAAFDITLVKTSVLRK